MTAARVREAGRGVLTGPDRTVGGDAREQGGTCPCGRWGGWKGRRKGQLPEPRNRIRNETSRLRGLVDRFASFRFIRLTRCPIRGRKRNKQRQKLPNFVFAYRGAGGLSFCRCRQGTRSGGLITEALQTRVTDAVDVVSCHALIFFERITSSYRRSILNSG